MNELIDKAIAYSRELSTEGRLYESIAVDHIIDLAESMLEKEKEVMCQFQSDGQRTDFWVKYEDNEDCFDETFKTQER